MSDGTTTIGGITVPSTDPIFLGIVGVHVVLGVISVIAGLIAMLSAKAPGRHPRFGTLYFWSLAAIFVSVTAMSAMRWAHTWHLFILGVFAFAAAIIGRSARRGHWKGWARIHIAGMGTSYILLLTAFYVDNGKQLPLWRELPTWTYWTLPALVGVPIILWLLAREPTRSRG